MRTRHSPHGRPETTHVWGQMQSSRGHLYGRRPSCVKYKYCHNQTLQPNTSWTPQNTNALNYLRLTYTPSPAQRASCALNRRGHLPSHASSTGDFASRRYAGGRRPQGRRKLAKHTLPNVPHSISRGAGDCGGVGMTPACQYRAHIW